MRCYDGLRDDPSPSVAAARLPPLPTLRAAAAWMLPPDRVVEGAASCVTLRVELEDGVEHSGSACPGSSGAAHFALPLPLSGGGQPGRITVKQPASTPGGPGRLWQQLISLEPSVQLSIDMRQAEVLQPEPVPAPTISATAPLPAMPAPTCSHQQQLRCCTDLEHAADLSLPAYQALAFPAPTCPALQPTAPSAPVPPSTQHAPARPSLLAGLAAACTLQAAAIAALLSRRGTSGGCVVASATGGCQTAAEAAAPVRRRPALIDACTSPLALLASPFVRNRRQSGESLDSIPEEHPGVPQQTQQHEKRQAQQAQHGSPAAQQGGSPQVQQGQLGGSGTPPAGSFGSLAPAPAGWTRCALGLLCGPWLMQGMQSMQ